MAGEKASILIKMLNNLSSNILVIFGLYLAYLTCSDVFSIAKRICSPALSFIDIPSLIHRGSICWSNVGSLGSCSQVLGLCLWEFYISGALWGHTLMLDEKAWLSVSTLIYPKGVLLGLFGGQSILSTPDPTIHVFMELALCCSAQWCCKRNGPDPNCSHKVGSMELYKMCWHAERFRVPFTGPGGSSTAPEKQPPTISPHSTELYTVTIQLDKCLSPETHSLTLSAQF